MDEMPTFVADPLPNSVIEHDWYPVLNRPYAFLQWVQKAQIAERYVLMSEPDHIFLRPLPNFMRGDHPSAFPFFYIEPHKVGVRARGLLLLVLVCALLLLVLWLLLVVVVVVACCCCCCCCCCCWKRCVGGLVFCRRLTPPNANSPKTCRSSPNSCRAAS